MRSVVLLTAWNNVLVEKPRCAWGEQREVLTQSQNSSNIVTLPPLPSKTVPQPSLHVADPLDEDDVEFISLFAYFNSRKRCGVIGASGNHGVKGGPCLPNSSSLLSLSLGTRKREREKERERIVRENSSNLSLMIMLIPDL